MKPLELQVYKVWVNGLDGTAYCSAFTSDRDPGYPVNVDLAVLEKRIGDAELAAEFEASRCDALVAKANRTGTYWAPLGETWENTYDAATQRTLTLLRFATHPHYDEVES